MVSISEFFLYHTHEINVNDMNNTSARYIDTMLYVQKSRAISDKIRQEEIAIAEAQLALDLRQGITNMEKSVMQYRAWLGRFAGGSNSFYQCGFGNFHIYDLPANTPVDSPIFEENVERYRQDMMRRFRDLERKYEGITDSQILATIEEHKKKTAKLKAEKMMTDE